MSAELDFLPHGDPIGSIFESQKGQENDVFEFADLALSIQFRSNHRRPTDSWFRFKSHEDVGNPCSVYFQEHYARQQPTQMLAPD
jgi:hypothetical protein